MERGAHCAIRPRVWISWVTPLLAASLSLEADSSCPTAPEVLAQLESLVDARTVSPSSRARLWHDRERLRVSLTDPERHFTTERSFPADASCEQQAEAAAVALATWMSALDAPSVVPPERQRARPLPAQETSTQVTYVRRRPPLLTAWVGGGGSWGSEQWSWRWIVGATLSPNLGRLRILASYASDGPRLTEVGSGRAAWRQQQVGIGAAYPVWERGIRLDLELNAAWIRFRARGEGFDQDLSGRASGFGIGPGMRGTLPVGALAPWAALGAQGWLARPTLRVEGPGETARPSPWALQGAAGVGVIFP